MLLVLPQLTHAEEEGWWNEEWSVRAPITIDVGPEAGNVAEPVGESAVLIRLHDGNFTFSAAKPDGSDIRFVAADGETLLPYHVEKYDGLLNEAFVWVKAPEVSADAPESFWLYYGNLGESVENVQDAAATFPESVILDYHFSTQPPVDSSAGGNDAENGGATVQGAMIGSGLRLDGQTSLKVPTAPELAWDAGGGASWSAWVKPVVDQPEAVIFARRDGADAFVIGIESGVPYLTITNGGATQKTEPGEALAAGTWRHVAVNADGESATLFVDGESYGTIEAALPALAGGAVIGGDPDAGDTLFIGELDELQLTNAVLPAGAPKFLAINQGGTADAGKLLAFGESEVSGHGGGGEHGGAMEHVMLFGDIAKNMMFDGWIAVGVCIVMMAVGWTVAFQKFNYLNRIQKGTEAFMQQWSKVSSDLTVLDKEGGLMSGVSKKVAKLMHKSPVYHLYHIGSQEIENRVGNGKRSQGLSARSIQAIRASLETGIVHENHRMNKGLIFLTISIAGGPYVGLLGTVVGVMITFAIIAKSGEVDVNSIAPGIASALLATVFGLLVAIPALFIYSFLSSRIRDLLASMQVFNDEFVAKMAEFYPTPAGTVVPVPQTEKPDLSSAHADVAKASSH
ncbi:MAG: DUF2341 domain-containing protein [Chthoniobacterales bacterium]